MFESRIDQARLYRYVPTSRLSTPETRLAHFFNSENTVSAFGVYPNESLDIGSRNFLAILANPRSLQCNYADVWHKIDAHDDSIHT